VTVHTCLSVIVRCVGLFVKMERKYKRIEVSADFLADMFKDQDYRCETTMPEDAEFVRMYPDIQRDTYWIVLWSDEWEVVPEGGKIPQFSITVTEYDENSTRR
jgi:hypothetical protein